MKDGKLPIERWTSSMEIKRGALDREARQIDISDRRFCVLIVDLGGKGGTLRPGPGNLSTAITAWPRRAGLMRILFRVPCLRVAPGKGRAGFRSAELHGCEPPRASRECRLR